MPVFLNFPTYSLMLRNKNININMTVKKITHDIKPH